MTAPSTDNLLSNMEMNMIFDMPPRSSLKNRNSGSIGTNCMFNLETQGRSIFKEMQHLGKLSTILNKFYNINTWSLFLYWSPERTRWNPNLRNMGGLDNK